MESKATTEADAHAEEYESDPEDSPLPAMRRREAASDDEEGSDGGEDPPQKKNEPMMARNVRSDGESDGQGGAEVYDDEDVDDYDEEEGEYDELGEEFEEELEEVNGNEVLKEKRQGELEAENREGNKEENGDEENKEGEKKENEPYAVPTTGAFYMHDDRFQENGRGGRRRRRMYGGGRKIWNPKDERAWVHDRFEEMTIHEPRRDDERRRPRGRYRGRGGGGGRGPRRVGGGGDRGGSYPRGGGRGSRSYYDDGQNHSTASRPVRGRGQRRYEPVNRNNLRNQPPQEKQILQRVNEQGPNPTATSTGTRQHSQAQNSNTLSSSLQKKQTFSSSLNSASPPFYPSNSSNNNQDLSVGMRHNAQNSGPIQSDNRGKSIAVGSTLAPNNSTATAVRVQGRGAMGNNNSQIPRVSSQVPASVAQNRPVSGTVSGLGEDGVSSGSPTNKLKGSVSGSKGKATGPTGTGTGSGALMYGGAQVIGTTGPMSMSHGEQGFPGTPALLPVMQFSGQHHGVPGAVGMALPGYVAQSQLGFGNSEMTWVPVLAGAAGSLGGSYCPPYIALEGGYYNNASRPSSQISSSAPAREAGAVKSPDGSKSSQKPELPTEEPGQRQNKPRRYSEMNFGQ